MENNQNTDNPNFNLGSGNKQIDLMRISMPEWLQELFRNPAIGFYPDINENIIDGYPTDDDF
jgi:hypothetical protein